MFGKYAQLLPPPSITSSSLWTMKRSSANWSEGSLAFRTVFFPGTVAAGDGVVFEIAKPTREETNGDVASFFTRKGLNAYN